MRILVTGANGLVGKKLVKQLVASGKHEVYATSLKKMQLDGAQTFTSNLQNADINNLVEQLKLEAIVYGILWDGLAFLELYSVPEWQ